jgi:hypothetical protein
MKAQVRVMASFLSVLLILVSSACFALGGDKEGNGGDICTKKNEVMFLDRCRVLTKVPFDFDKAGWFDALDAALSRHPGFVETVYFAGENGEPMTMHRKIMQAFRSLRFYFVKELVPPVGDRGHVQLTVRVGGRVRRLALQLGGSATVLVNREAFELMLRFGQLEDVLAFFMHEALIRVYKDDRQIAIERPLKDIGQIATLVGETFPAKKHQRGPLSAVEVAQMLCDAWIPAGIASPDGLEFIESMYFPAASYPEKVIAFAMSAGQCEVMKWTLDGPASGLQVGHFRDWSFLEQTEDGYKYKVRLIYQIGAPDARQPYGASLFYMNLRPNAVSDFIVFPMAPLKILRIYKPARPLSKPGTLGHWPRRALADPNKSSGPSSLNTALVE